MHKAGALVERRTLHLPQRTAYFPIDQGFVGDHGFAQASA
jgi:hypothetical protein